MNIHLTESQVRQVALDSLIGHLKNKDDELNYAVKYVLKNCYRVGSSLKHENWEIKRK